MIIYILLTLFIIFCLFYDYFKDKFYELNDMQRRTVLIGLIAILVAIGLYQHKMDQNYETFDVVLPTNPTKNIDLKDFFKFIEYYQLNTMDPNIFNAPVSHNEEEHVTISNDIRNLLDLLTFISGNKFYKKYCDGQIVEIDDYYNYTKIKVDLGTIKTFIENDINVDNSKDSMNIYKKFIIPMQTIIELIGKIANTSIYWDYLNDNRFQAKYAGLTLNPHLVKL